MPEASSLPADRAARTRRIVAVVAALNLGYFFVEFAVAQTIGSVSLFADSVDFLEDASINLLVLGAMGLAAASRRRVALLLAGLMLVPGAAALWTAWHQVAVGAGPPEATALTATGVGALAVNATCMLLLARVRSDGGALSLAAFLSARNDVLANVAIIGAGLATAATGSIWPDVIVGVGIALINAEATRVVYRAAMGESDDDDGAMPGSHG